MSADEHQARLNGHRRTNGKVFRAANGTASKLTKGANRAQTLAKQAQRDLSRATRKTKP